jgi:AraC-like DNA-binding protein
MNITLAAACLTEKWPEALEHLHSILEMMDALVSDSRITYAVRHGGLLLHDIPRHFHENEYQLEYFVEGNGTVYTGNRWMEFSPGSLCFIPPGIAHEIIYPKSGTMDNYSVKFKLGADFRQPAPAGAFVTEVSDERKPIVLGLLKNLAGEYVQDIPSSPEKLRSLVRIINEIKSIHSERVGKNSLVNRIKQIVNANISKKLHITEIAYQLDLSHEYVSRLFRKHTGQTLTSYINSQRLESSLVMLKNTDIPFKKIAADCGFKSVNYFHTMFKKHFSLTPRNIRKHKDIEIPI